jgi:Tfp pilus assembly protein PilF
MSFSPICRALLLVLPLLSAGCGPSGPSPASDAIVTEHLDRGNGLYGAGDAAGARAEYRAALEADATSAAAWFGVYMASTLLGDDAAAEEALGHVNRLAPDAGWQGHPHAAGAAPAHPPTGGAP